MLNRLALSLILINLLINGSNAMAASCNLEKSHFIAAVIESENEIEVWINTRAHWMSEGALTDSYSSKESRSVDKITDVLNLCNLAESTYSPCGEGRSIKQIKKDLESVCVQIQPEFQTWAEKEIKK